MRIPPSIMAFRRRRGTTLIELTVGLVVGLAIASASMAMLTQQLNFTRLLRDQTFLMQECPQINNILSRMLGRIDSYRIYDSLDSAKAGGASVLTGGTSLRLSFRDSLNRFQFAVISFEADTVNGGNRLAYYYSQNGSTWAAEPGWVIGRGMANVEFFVENGVLRIRMTGPNGERVTYSGHTQS